MHKPNFINMNKLILLLYVGAFFFTSCHKEEFNTPPRHDNPEDTSTEESVKTIKKLHLEKVPNKSSYLLNETLILDGISINVTYTDGTVSNLSSETIHKEWLSNFSTEKPFKGKEIIIQPIDVPAECQVSFTVDVLPLIVENNIVVSALESAFKIIQIPEGIKSIKDEAFGNNQTLEGISFPSTLENIGAYAFYGSNLKTVDFSKSALKKLPSGTFESCMNLTQVILPKTLKEIGSNAFYGTAQLKYIQIPEGVEEIGYTAFSNSGLVTVKLPNSIRTIKRSFYKCNELKEVTTYGNNYIGNDYIGNDLERSILGESFQFCPNLETLQIPGGISRIGISVLGACKVKELIIPSNVEHIEFNAFGNVTSLQKVLLLGEKKKTIENEAFPASVMESALKQNETLTQK